MTSEEYRDALLGLLPPGAYWDRVNLACRIARLYHAWGDELERDDLDLVGLVDEADVRTADELLDAWERNLGLPDPCVPPALQPSTYAERREAAHARLIATGGQTPAYLEELVLALGIGPPVNILEGQYLPFRCGIGRCGDRLNAHGSQFIFTVQGPAATSVDRRAWAVCLIDRVKPAHTIALYDWSL